MKYVIIGSSAAGIQAGKELRRLDPSSEICMISKDLQVYSRCILHHYLGDVRTVEQLNFAERDYFKKYNIKWFPGRTVESLDREEKKLIMTNGEQVSYGKLLIATGSHTFIPPIPGIQNTKNVIGFRNLDDIDWLKKNVNTDSKVVIIGAGLVGLDCTCGLLEKGITPTIVETAPHLLIKQLDYSASDTYARKFSEVGVQQYYDIGVTEVKSDSQGYVSEVILSDGTAIPCTVLIVTAGVRSNVEFLEGSGVEVDKFGLLYDESGKTNDENIYGAGDVSGRAPIWPVAVKEGIVAANNMAGGAQKMTDFFASKSTMNFLGIPTMSLGISEPEEGDQVEIEEKDDNYKKIIHRAGKIKGAILQGDLSYGGILQQMIAHNIDVSKVKKSLFNIDYSDFFHVNDNFEYYYDEEAIAQQMAAETR